MVVSPAMSSQRGQRTQLRLAALGASALLATSLWNGMGWAIQGMRCLPAGRAGRGGRPSALRTPVSSTQRVRMQAGAATATTDTFDPWTVLGISTEAGVQEARKAYKKLIAKYHPDVDPSPEAEIKFQQAVRAHAIVTGEDKDLDTATLLKNAVENLRSDIEFKRQQIENMRLEAASEEAKIVQMQEQLEQAEVQRSKVTQELGAYGGGTLGLLVAGPTGAILGAAVGLALKDREDSIGQVIRGVGTLTKGVVDAVGRSIQKKE
mmetsp:Transcript_7947/g.22508  ORF Transcript_7947/g.22508 Transcript_7947/m.22508 type:complete len:264 (-) Transcript_7947:271-1062(-)